MLEELDIRNLGPIREATIAPAAGMTAITGETGAGKSMLLSAIRLVSGGAAESSRVSAGADEAWAQAIFALSDDAVASEHSGDTNDAGSGDADSGFTGAAAAVAKAHDAGVDPEDGELFLSRTVRASGRSRAVLGGKSVPRSVLGAIAGELVTIHGQTDQLKIAASSRQREFLDRVAGDEAELAAYRKAWDALAAMDERLERLRSQESSARQQADYLRESIDRINRIDPQPGEDEELKARRERIENAADIAQGVGSALGALDASQVDVDAADGASAVELINHAVTSLRAIRVGGTFSEQADRLESINADLGDVVFALSQELGDEGSVEDLDQINGRIHELGDLARRWGPTLADVLAWRDKAAFDLEDLDASPEKPFLGMGLKIDKYIVSQLMTELPMQAKVIDEPVRKGLSVTPIEADILDAFVRLTELLDNPEQIPVLAPMIVREIYYRLLTGPRGKYLRAINTTGTRGSRIAQAITWLRNNYKEPLQVDELAKKVNMATSTFHRHFKQITTLSPLQYQKRLRLYEAQRLMLVENEYASNACLAVGYESPTQFNREYKRLFGEPPARNIHKTRELQV